MDRARLDEVVARLEDLGPEPRAASPAAWRELWRLARELRSPSGGPGAAGEPPGSVAACAEDVDRWLDHPDQNLAVYGTLRPGQRNHALVAGLGSWRSGTVRGRLGDWQGYPILRCAADAAHTVPVMVLKSARLPALLVDLDAFEGPAYRRARLVVELDDDLDHDGDAVGTASEPRPRPAGRPGPFAVAWCYVQASDNAF